MLEKTERPIKNGQSRDTGNTRHNTHNNPEYRKVKK